MVVKWLDIGLEMVGLWLGNALMFGQHVSPMLGNGWIAQLLGGRALSTMGQAD